MTNPEQGYHLEIAFRDEESRVMLAKCMQRLGLPIRISARREHSYLYLKQSDQIVTLLTALGAHTSVMHIEDLRIRLCNRSLLRGSTRRMPRWNSWVNRWTRPLEKAALTIGSGG